MFTNIEIYRSIAIDALAASRLAIASHKHPRPDGVPGSVITFDPSRTSFKQSLIAIAFAAMYLEALLFLEGSQRLGKSTYLGLEREYELRLKRIAVVGDELIQRCARFRAVRNDLVHEKATENLREATIWLAQREADKALALVRDVAQALGRPWPDT